LTDQLRALALLLPLALATPAVAAPLSVDLGASVGYRHSLTLGAGGLSLGVSLAGIAGPIGVEYETLWTNDHTLKVSERIAGRNDNRLNLLIVPIHRTKFRLVFGGGGSLGWVKPPGKAVGPGERTLSQGAQEFIRFDFRLDADDVGVVYGLRLGASHRWQADVVQAPDHAIEVALQLSFGPAVD
jgi:hypothetical protein